MATSLRSSFVGGMALSSISKAVEPRTSRSRLHLRAVADGSPSTAMRGSSNGNGVKPDGEVSRLIGTGIERPGELWWAPLFHVSTEDQWSKLLTTKEVKQQRETEQTTLMSSPAASTSIALPDLIDSTPAAPTSIALPDLIDSTTNQNGPSPTTKLVAFTPEKARALRKSMRAAETWHDGWYHSAIASRLAKPE